MEVSRSSSRASLHVIVTFTMDPLAVLAGMDAMDAAGVPVEEIPDSDGEFDDRSPEGSDVDVLSLDEKELLDDELLGDGTSSGASGDSSQSGTEDSDEDSDEQNDGGAVRGCGRRARGGRGRRRGLGRGNPVGRGIGNLRGRERGGRGRGAGGRGRGRGGAHANYDAAFGYNDEDDGGLNGFPQFTPDTEPGLNLPEDFHPTDFAPSLPNFAKKLKTRNFDTSFGQHSLTFFYYFAHFCFAMQPSFQKMYGLLFAILLPF